jgi:hypothetical protein
MLSWLTLLNEPERPRNTDATKPSRTNRDRHPDYTENDDAVAFPVDHQTVADLGVYLKAHRRPQLVLKGA